MIEQASRKYKEFDWCVVTKHSWNRSNLSRTLMKLFERIESNWVWNYWRFWSLSSSYASFSSHINYKHGINEIKPDMKQEWKAKRSDGIFYSVQWWIDEVIGSLFDITPVHIGSLLFWSHLDNLKQISHSETDVIERMCFFTRITAMMMIVMMRVSTYRSTAKHSGLSRKHPIEYSHFLIKSIFDLFYSILFFFFSTFRLNDFKRMNPKRIETNEFNWNQNHQQVKYNYNKGNNNTKTNNSCNNEVSQDKQDSGGEYGGWL